MHDTTGEPPRTRREHRARRASAPAPRTPGRAGRNLPAAIVVGLLLIGLVIASLLLYPPLFVLLVTAVAAIGIWELDQALRVSRVRPPLAPMLLGAALVPLAYLGGTRGLAVGFVAAAALVLLWRSVGAAKGALRDVGGGVFVIAYVPLLAAITPLMLVEDQGALRVLTYVLVTVASDTGGYAVGVNLGRTPMAPSLSPKKSWEGFAGSVGASAVIGLLAVVFLLGGPWWAGLLLGAVAASFATVGDLAESAIKRDIGIKDMGSLLPGHGGVMDRLDSLLVTAPVCWALMHLFV
ncbi:phosphatidate cytidylyltransferase [Ornithinimicrobium avium]|uniref:Phosphatidate cytidylyltransferase n=1 Tax=Ornithinimicrobium avium TaxID=2283195 RepID=A0A345NIP2_9MICO|nr:phosphatidate cytidylyltransferase [Ornithinimicrobium avium]AXH94900.1 phosphatidate cytidylyltransferase [Ornithinimicrobium avium]